MEITRRYAAIMITDIVGYTSLMGKDENKALDLLEKNRKIQKPLIKEFRGHFVKEMGDGIMARFSTSSEAIICAAKIQAKALEQNISLRIGLHDGEVNFQNNDTFGEVLNIASRIEPLALPGNIRGEVQKYLCILLRPWCGFIGSW